MLLSLFLSLLLATGAHADVSRCERLSAESLELQKNPAKACDESKETHTKYMAAFWEILQTCRKLEAEVAAGPVKLKLGTEDEMKSEIMEIKSRHMQQQQELTDHFNELLKTPLDLDPTKLPITVSSECGTEVEGYVRYRRSALRGLHEFFVKMEEFDMSLFQQASERALPPATPVKVKNIR